MSSAGGLVVRNLMLQVQRVDLRNANTNSYVAATFTLPAANRQLPASCIPHAPRSPLGANGM
ncbi:hypothetical protein CHLNCDRAFT_135111 [Chlorella variabilis]|uniref:Uncharacterized protein n=1 Tax=Chlorella variabilis TaxID=554065 RepID=E1ZHI7_CHLVA|nr:hypothetical protein CHLNCDRAFT_135111 [Chlorella variabilis]EFN54470.1 hypothetical protein CHLNCDRAFT_135111 [Chlorella variabilis]|eukprot:XP_005846572.1 hypothetical protein CHLNCDRAFT_135111 [Chlorella variabilis]